MEQQRTLVPTAIFSRIQSPSSINTFRQCPRKYYYRYIERYPTAPNIILIRGQIVHQALEDFFSLDLTPALNDEFSLKTVLLEFFKNNWAAERIKILALGLQEDALSAYYEESMNMLEFWFNSFYSKLSALSKIHGIDLAFKMLTPRVEEEYISTKLGVRGYIDAIHETNEHIKILDYKTSSKDTMTEDYKLQLAIYALLYEEKHGKKPNELSINFLKFGERYVEVTERLLEFAKNEVKRVHENTLSTDKRDYPKNITPLCKWSSGQCDFYNVCFKG